MCSRKTRHGSSNRIAVASQKRIAKTTPHGQKRHGTQPNIPPPLPLTAYPRAVPFHRQKQVAGIIRQDEQDKNERAHLPLGYELHSTGKTKQHGRVQLFTVVVHGLIDNYSWAARAQAPPEYGVQYLQRARNMRLSPG